MEGRKRPWEDGSPIDLHFKRRDLTNDAPVTSSSRQLSPLPQRAGHYSRDLRAVHQRRLPPLYPPSYHASAEPMTSQLVPVTAQPAPLDYHRPRSQSLFNILQHPHWQDRELGTERPAAYSETQDRNESPPTFDIEAHRPLFVTDPALHAAGAPICGPAECHSQECSNSRTLVRKLVAELRLLERKVRIVIQEEHHPSDEPHNSEHLNTKDTLKRALDLVQWSNFSLQEHLDRRCSLSPDSLFQPGASPNMRQNQHHLEEREEQSPPSRQYPNVHGYTGFTYPGIVPEDPRRLTYQGAVSSVGGSPHYTASSSGSAFMPPQSPMQSGQPMRPAILPSPSSLNFPSGATLPSISSPSAAGQLSAQSAHLQDLQHQISVKTLAFQTLQREYDSLLQKLERQRTKCAILEKKFEVSDVEINSLTDEKEKMQIQVVSLESQVDDLQQSRDEARQQLIDNGAQWMRIVEMANKLEGKGAEDKKKWDSERSELERRIRTLEGAMVTGTGQGPLESQDRTNDSSSTSPIPPPGASSTSQSETINVLRAEVGRLQSRTQTLETALHTMRQESISIQAAARQLVESGGIIENVARNFVGPQG